MQYKTITDRTIGYKFEITITTTNLSVVGSGPMWAPVKSEMKWEMKKSRSVLCKTQTQKIMQTQTCTQHYLPG